MMYELIKNFIKHKKLRLIDGVCIFNLHRKLKRVLLIYSVHLRMRYVLDVFDMFQIVPWFRKRQITKKNKRRR